MTVQIIDLKELANAYLKKAVYKFSNEGVNPSINPPRVQLKTDGKTKVCIGIVRYLGATENPYIAQDGTKYDLYMGTPHSVYHNLPNGWILLARIPEIGKPPFPGIERVDLDVYEVDLTVATRWSVEMGKTNTLYAQVIPPEGTAHAEYFPPFILTIEFVENGDNGLVNTMEIDPKHLLDPLEVNTLVVAGEECEWTNITLDGVQRKFLVAKA